MVHNLMSSEDEILDFYVIQHYGTSTPAGIFVSLTTEQN